MIIWKTGKFLKAALNIMFKDNYAKHFTHSKEGLNQKLLPELQMAVTSPLCCHVFIEIRIKISFAHCSSIFYNLVNDFGMLQISKIREHSFLYQ